MTMKLRARLLTVVTVLSLVGCQLLGSDWAETTATLEAFQDPDAGHGYKITYQAPESTAINAQGEPIKGPIDQYVMDIERPVKSQTVPIRYRKDEPILFEFLAEPEAQ